MCYVVVYKESSSVAQTCTHLRSGSIRRPGGLRIFFRPGLNLFFSGFCAIPAHFHTLNVLKITKHRLDMTIVVDRVYLPSGRVAKMTASKICV